MLRTHSSSFAISVSSSQGFTSSKMEDLATNDLLLAFFDSYCARRSSLSRFASSLSYEEKLNSFHKASCSSAQKRAGHHNKDQSHQKKANPSRAQPKDGDLVLLIIFKSGG
uniref:Uncharacterized protein n=1 Tax=Panthera leo TaxID=9689 RepID=A0A8C8WZX3_PANLE